MKYRRFGRTEMMLSQYSLGCMQFTGKSKESNAIRTVERAVELGVNPPGNRAWLRELGRTGRQGAEEDPEESAERRALHHHEDWTVL